MPEDKDYCDICGRKFNKEMDEGLDGICDDCIHKAIVNKWQIVNITSEGE